MNVAQKCREEKTAHPERYCRVRDCLWNVARSGACKKHGTPVVKDGAGMVAALGNEAASASHRVEDLTPSPFLDDKPCDYCGNPFLEGQKIIEVDLPFAMNDDPPELMHEDCADAFHLGAPLHRVNG